MILLTSSLNAVNSTSDSLEDVIVTFFSIVAAIFVVVICVSIFVTFVKYLLRCISLSNVGKLCGVSKYGLVFVPIYGFVKESEIYNKVGQVFNGENWSPFKHYRSVFVVASILNKILYFVLVGFALFVFTFVVDDITRYDAELIGSLTHDVIGLICLSVYLGLAYLKACVMQDSIGTSILAVLIPNCFGFYVYCQVKNKLNEQIVTNYNTAEQYVSENIHISDI